MDVLRSAAVLKSQMRILFLFTPKAVLTELTSLACDPRVPGTFRDNQNVNEFPIDEMICLL